jgi:cytochrome c-type biogenesis protein CcmH
MTEFWIVAGCMSLLALGFLAWPIWRAWESSGHWPVPSLIAAAALVPVALLTYQHVRTWSGTAQTSGVSAASAEQLDVVNQLAERMQANPDNVEGWMLLGRSYLTLQQYGQARMAFEQAAQRTPVPDNELKLSLAMATIFSDPTTIAGQGGQLIEEVLASEPENPQALWMGGLIAAERGRPDLARARWTTLLELNPGPQIVAAVRSQLAELGVAPAAQPSRQSVAADAGPVIRLRLSLGEAFSTTDFGPSARLFIFARAQAGGPPLAVVPASVGDLPGEFTLSDANVMIQGNRLSNFDEIQLVARISRSGSPSAQSGDVFAQTRYNVAEGGVVEMVLDQVAP